MTEKVVPLILSNEPVSRFQVLGRRPQLGAGVALVYSDSRGQVSAVRGQPTRGELAFAGYTRQYEVDVARHHDQLTLDLPSKVDSYVFRCEFGVVWYVSDPERIVRDQIDDGLKVIRFHLHAKLQSVSREYEIDEYRNFEQRINELFQPPAAVEWHPVPGGIVLQLTARVGLDEVGTIAMGDRRTFEVNQELMRRKQVHEQAMAAFHDEHEAKRKLAQQKTDLEIKKIQDDRELQYERDKKLLELEGERMRTEQYAEAMSRGDGALLAMHLGRNPDDTGKVITMIAENNSLNNKARVDLLTQMIDKGHIQEADMDGLRPEIINGVKDLLVKTRPGLITASPMMGLSPQALAATAEQIVDVKPEPDPADDEGTAPPSEKED
ncbi:hypothetical protein [Longispora urticae]